MRGGRGRTRGVGSPSACVSSVANDKGHTRRPTNATINRALVVVIVIWGLGPSVTKLITAPPVVGASVRFWISVPVLLAVAFGSGRRTTFAVLRGTAVAGILFAVNMILVFSALQRTSVTVLAVVQALNPGLVLVVAGRWLGERATARHVVATVLGIFGVVVVVLAGDPETSGDGLGLLYAVSSLLAFVGYYVISRRARTTTSIDPVQWMTGVTLFAAIAITPVVLLSSSAADFRTIGVADWAYLAFIAVAVGVVSHALVSWVHAFMSASRSSTALLAFNVVAVAAAWPINGEPVTWLQVLGGLMVLGSVGFVLRQPAIAGKQVEELPFPPA